jgi:hypothetical protein
MKKTLAVLVALSLPMAAMATCTWTTSATGTEGNVVCTTAGETAIAGAAAATVGWPVNQCKKGMTFQVCTAAGQAVTAALTLSVYLQNSTAALWAKYPDGDMTSGTITATERCQIFDGKWLVVSGGRVAVIPTAGTVDGGSLTIFWNCN